MELIDDKDPILWRIAQERSFSRKHQQMKYLYKYL